jgi:IS66 Orf2 like protein
MLSWPPTVRIFLCSDATDMRKGFDSLAQLVESSLALDPLSGHLYVFRSRRGDRIKILYFYCIQDLIRHNGICDILFRHAHFTEGSRFWIGDLRPGCERCWRRHRYLRD